MSEHARVRCLLYPCTHTHTQKVFLPKSETELRTSAPKAVKGRRACSSAEGKPAPALASTFTRSPPPPPCSSSLCAHATSASAIPHHLTSPSPLSPPNRRVHLNHHCHIYFSLSGSRSSHLQMGQSSTTWLFTARSGLFSWICVLCQASRVIFTLFVAYNC